ncbi:MAG: hypothetical protein AAGG01_21945, partial [Planctomycetota bacterium]
MGRIIAFSSFALLALGGASAGADAPASVTVRWRLPDREVFPGETFPIGLEVSIPGAWLEEGSSEGELLQLFPQPLG